MGPGARVDTETVLKEPAPLHSWPRAEFRPDVQGLRAVAVVLVVLSHAGVPGLAGGYVGVDVFFVISGFVITGLLTRQPPRRVRRNLAYFYQRRIRRIVPAATLTLVVTAIAARAMLGANFDARLLDDVRWAALFAANFRFIATSANYFIPGVAPSLVTHFWSLGVEEQFYLCYPIVVFSLTWLAPPARRRGALAGFLVLGVGASAWWSAHLTHVAPISAYYSPLTRFWELALGGLVAVAPAAWARRTPTLNSLAAVASLAVLGVAVWRLSATSAFPGVLAWWPCGAAAVLLYTGAASRRASPATWLSWRPCRYVGDISYSLYLWHYPWLMLPAQLAHPYTSPLARVVEVGGAFACAVLSYHLVENPLRRSRRLEGDGVSVALLLGVCVAASVVTTLVIARVAPL
ncbi:MAG: acyltransferase [Acidobacteriota bacterium]|nr:acyltransferase [Acidobacteriota bacterium]